MNATRILTLSHPRRIANMCIHDRDGYYHTISGRICAHVPRLAQALAMLTIVKTNYHLHHTHTTSDPKPHRNAIAISF